MDETFISDTDIDPELEREFEQTAEFDTEQVSEPETETQYYDFYSPPTETTDKTADETSNVPINNRDEDVIQNEDETKYDNSNTKFKPIKGNSVGIYIEHDMKIPNDVSFVVVRTTKSIKIELPDINDNGEFKLESGNKFSYRGLIIRTISENPLIIVAATGSKINMTLDKLMVSGNSNITLYTMGKTWIPFYYR